MSKPPSKSVFVGNIPYGLTEEQIVDIFSSAGNVINFRLVYDRETGRPKGFGFAEYPDSDSAASAVRNLNDYEIMNRKLRVDFSNDGGEEENSAPTYQPPPLNTNGLPVPPPSLPITQPSNTSSLPPLPIGVELPQGLNCPDAISRTLNTLPPSQLLDVLSQMKTLASTDPQKATELLHQAPQLSYAIFQALLLMGLVQPEALSSVIESSIAAPSSAPPGSNIPPPVASTPQYGGSAYPPGYPPPPPHMSGQMGMPIMGTPPVQGYAPPPQQRQAPPPPAQIPEPDTNALMAQVMAMPQELIDSLPPADRAQLMALREQYRG
ncbi:62b80042-f770-4791-a7ff-b96da0f3e9e6 [Sclerotinia trifoliorum]|uniref:62b80042-f770-4791-a7ff-b96da0f3e9e6 n=1 Tax=Sclerotinia trifoliorum TaxID=28548 RepID=A0A8H2W415_9HELO|nr:62b80042-f770-4791-a7ff-b96da0f3e9e6 [Sclerotinia trifoliorum]